MANPTLLDIKDFVADTLGTGNGSTSVPKRDRLINKARKKFYSERQWSFLFKSATVSISSQLGSLPSDYNYKFTPIRVYTYASSSQGDTKYQYTQVDWDDIQYYATSEYVYAIDKVNSQIKINQTSVSSITFDYTHIPADAPIDTTQDATAEKCPDITAIGLLSVAMWWLSSERATGKYQLFKDMYDQELANFAKNDAYQGPVKPLKPRYQRINTGYIGVK